MPRDVVYRGECLDNWRLERNTCYIYMSRLSLTLVSYLMCTISAPMQTEEREKKNMGRVIHHEPPPSIHILKLLFTISPPVPATFSDSCILSVFESSLHSSYIVARLNVSPGNAGDVATSVSRTTRACLAHQHHEAPRDKGGRINILPPSGQYTGDKRPNYSSPNPPPRASQ